MGSAGTKIMSTGSAFLLISIWSNLANDGIHPIATTPTIAAPAPPQTTQPTADPASKTLVAVPACEPKNLVIHLNQSMLYNAAGSTTGGDTTDDTLLFCEEFLLNKTYFDFATPCLFISFRDALCYVC